MELGNPPPRRAVKTYMGGVMAAAVVGWAAWVHIASKEKEKEDNVQQR